jgi:peroxiredoxin Q/BCP
MPAPEMRGEAIDGRPIDLVDFRPKPVLLEFLRGTWCPNCAKRIAQLREWHPKFREAGAEVIAVYCQKREALASWFARRPVPFPVVADQDRSIAKRWDVYVRLNFESVHIARPASFVVGGDGVLRFVRVGSNQFDRAPLEEALETIRVEPPVDRV